MISNTPFEVGTNRSPPLSIQHKKLSFTSFQAAPSSAKTYSPSSRFSSETVKFPTIPNVPTHTLPNNSVKDTFVFDVPPTTTSYQCRPAVDNINLISACSTNTEPAFSNTNSPKSLPSSHYTVTTFEKNFFSAPSWIRSQRIMNSVYTKTADSVKGALSLATQTPNVLCNSLLRAIRAWFAPEKIVVVARINELKSALCAYYLTILVYIKTIIHLSDGGYRFALYGFRWIVVKYHLGFCFERSFLSTMY